MKNRGRPCRVACEYNTQALPRVSVRVRPGNKQGGSTSVLRYHPPDASSVGQQRYGKTGAQNGEGKKSLLGSETALREATRQAGEVGGGHD